MAALAEQALSWIGQLVVYGGGAVAIAFATFKWLGERWLEDKFKLRLAEVQHDHAKELQRLKARVDSMASGVIRLHAKEFEVLPELWGLLDEAFGLVQWIASPVQIGVAVDRLSDDEFKELVEALNLSPSGKARILGNPDRHGAYDRAQWYARVDRVKDAIRKFQNYASRNTIFLPADLRGAFDKLSGALWSSVSGMETSREAADWKMQREVWGELQERTAPLVQGVRSLIEKRLRTQAELQLDADLTSR